MFTSPNIFNIVSQRARRALEELETRLQTGSISTRIDLLAHLVETVSKFARGVRTPSMEVPDMKRDELLIREYLTEPILQANDDVEVANSQIDLLRESTRQIFNVCQSEKLGLSERLSELTSLVDTFRLWVSDSDPSFVWAGDSFNDTTKVDMSSTVLVETVGGTVTLKPEASATLSDRVISLTIDKTISAGGLPGNNLEIRQPGREALTGDRPEPRPILFSESQPRKDSVASILDGDPGTWFEWERNYITTPQPTIRAGKAIVYDAAGKLNRKIRRLNNWNCFIRWPGEFKVDTGIKRKGYPLAYFSATDRRTLRLAFQILLDEPRVISWLSLTPLIRFGAYPEIEQVIVSNDGLQWRNLLETPIVLHPRMNRGIDFADQGASASNFEGVGVVPFPSTPIQYVKIIMRQNQTYEAPLGLAHTFYMGIKKRKRTKGPIQVVGSSVSTLAESSSVDFELDSEVSQQRVVQSFDIFRGERQAIAIRDLLLEQRSYAAEGQMVSKEHTLPRPIRSVALLTDDFIPEDWEDFRPDGTPWIAYEISPDGNTWYQIIPQVGTLENSVVRLPELVTTLYLRVNMSRPDDRTTESPILRSYALKLLPEAV